MTGAGGIFSAPLRLFTVDPGRPFLRDLAETLLSALGRGEALAEAEIFLPNRRSAQALSAAFLEASCGAPLLAPRLRPLGEADEALLDLYPDDAAADDAPAISPVERRIILARFVAAARDVAVEGEASFAAALAGADALAALLDSLYTEEIDVARLAAAAPAEFAAHWARSYAFIRAATERWPDYLAHSGLDDPARRQARAIRRLAQRCAGDRSGRPLIIAGTTGSAPAVRALIAAVLAAPRGLVVLPGLDRALAADAKGWAAVDDPHPQAGLKALLAELKIDARAVRPLVESVTPRARLISAALRPSGATDDWRERLAEIARDDAELMRAAAGLSLVEADDEDGEATAIAIALREALETPTRRAILVTPDRALARRVAAKMRRWNVDIFDSAGAPFADTFCGAYLRLVAEYFSAPADPSRAVALLRHPLAGLGLDGAARRAAVDAFDRAARGLAPLPETGGLAAKIAASGGWEAQAALRAIAPPPEFSRAGVQPLGLLLRAHLDAAEAIAATADTSGPARLWRGIDGEAGSVLFSQLLAASDQLGDAPVTEYPAIFAALSAASVAPPRGGHPRLAILGPLEARLQHADLVILSGLNEGVWPAAEAADPFLSRGMRKALGLPAPERGVGLAAHDFAVAAAAPEVLITRAKRRDGAPAKPSRWIVRLKNILAAAGALQRVDASPRCMALSRALDAAGAPHAVAPPRPTPPLAARPRKLSVTRIETFLRDPYAIYAQKILRLDPLDPLAAPFEPRHLGTLLHAAYERFVTEKIDPEAADARARLIVLFAALAPDYGMSRAAFALWRPTLEHSADVFLDGERARREKAHPFAVEAAGETVLDLPGGAFLLTARADRIDLTTDGKAVLLDYKTTTPSKREMAAFRVQLPLTALIVERGGFEALGPRQVNAFFYLEAKTRADVAKASGYEGADARAAIDAAAKGVVAWLATFDSPDTPYLSQPRPKFVDDRSPYDLLARRREWSVEGDDA